MPLGKYYIREIKAPYGFVLNDKIQDIELNYKDQNTQIVFADSSFTNNRQKIEINVVKKDTEEEKEIPGAELGLYAKDNILNNQGHIIVKEGELIQTLISDENGKIEFTADLPLGRYYIKEIKAPIGYITSNQTIEIDATYQTQEIDVIYYEYKFKNQVSKVEISKQDITNGEEIEGAYLSICEKDSGIVIENWISGEDGKNEDGTIKKHIVKGLEIGKTYILKETFSPYGFAISDNIEFTIEDINEVQKVVMKDDVIFGQLNFNKTGEVFNQTVSNQTEFGKTETPIWNVSNLCGAKITVYANEEIKIGNTIYYKKDEIVEVLESNSEITTSKKLPVGKYYYVETTTPNGYLVDTNKHHFEIQNNQSSQNQLINSTLENKRPKVEINMRKVLEEQEIFLDSDNYKDVIFGIFAKEDIYNYKGDIGIQKGTMISTSGIDENGHLKDFPDIPYGRYYLKELSTNNQYILDNLEYDFEITYQGKDIFNYTIQIGENGIISNRLARGIINIQKTDTLDSQKKLQNVEFSISKKEDMSDIITTTTTNENGLASFKDLELGTYYIQETKTIDGYVTNDYIYTAKISKNGDVLTINCENKPTQMEFYKTDEMGKEALPGASLQIIDKASNEIIEEWVSLKENHIVHYLTEGKEYIVKEINAPYGYEIAKEINFVARDGKKVIIKNTPIMQSVRVEKLDKDTKEHIKSNKFEFAIYKDEACTELIRKAKANEYEGTALFESLIYGTYYIKETKAPIGYTLSSQVVEIVINEHGVFADGSSLVEKDNVYSFIYYNTLQPIFQTGNETNYILLFFIIISSLIGIMIALIIKKNKTKKER